MVSTLVPEMRYPGFKVCFQIQLLHRYIEVPRRVGATSGAARGAPGGEQTEGPAADP
jgi:hypothetical protein